jgi:hypothetical protein
MRLAHTHPAWGRGFADEVWGSRLAQPAQPRWSEEGTIPRLDTRTCAQEEAAPKALAWYGRLVRSSPPQADQRLLRFVAGRPVSAVPRAFLAWWSERLAAQGLTALCLSWDHASWQKSQAVRTGRRRHNQQGKATGHGVRLVACRLPVQSPGRNPIEPPWVHGNRAVSEPTRLLSADALEARVYAYYGCEGEMHLSMPQKVA